MKDENREVLKMLALISQLALSMMVPIFLCVYLGYYIDEKFHTSFFIPLMILGILAGVRNCYILIKKARGDQGEQHH